MKNRYLRYRVSAVGYTKKTGDVEAVADPNFILQQISGCRILP